MTRSAYQVPLLRALFFCCSVRSKGAKGNIHRCPQSLSGFRLFFSILQKKETEKPATPPRQMDLFVDDCSQNCHSDIPDTSYSSSPRSPSPVDKPIQSGPTPVKGRKLKRKELKRQEKERKRLEILNKRKKGRANTPDSEQESDSGTEQVTHAVKTLNI
jgi:hypothetical protein